MSQLDATRALLGPADPARGMPEPEFRLPAMALIDRAATVEDVRLPARRRPLRFALTAATALAASAAIAVVVVPGTGGDDRIRPPATRTEAGFVVTPVAFEITDNPPAAGDELRRLAKRIVDAPYDARTGRYAYVHSKTWGDPQMSSEGGKYSLGYTHADETWHAANRPGVQRTRMLPYEYPDEASRDYYKTMPPPEARPAVTPIDAVGALPTDRAGLARLLYAGRGTGGVAKAVNTVYSRYALTRVRRAMVLDILADEPGFRWRGEVTDRSGRKGVAITGDERGGRSVLIFDPVTGALLASEHVILRTPTPLLSAYAVFLAYDRRHAAPAPGTVTAPRKPGTVTAPRKPDTTGAPSTSGPPGVRPAG